MAVNIEEPWRDLLYLPSNFFIDRRFTSLSTAASTKKQETAAFSIRPPP